MLFHNRDKIELPEEQSVLPAFSTFVENFIIFQPLWTGGWVNSKEFLR